MIIIIISSLDKILYLLLFSFQIAERHQAMSFKETSAKQGTNVHEIFYDIAYTLTDTYNPRLVSTVY